MCLCPSAVSCPTLTLQDPGGMDYLYFYATCLQSSLPVAGLHLHLINVTDGMGMAVSVQRAEPQG